MKALGEQLISVDPGTGKRDQWYGGHSMRIQYVSVFFKKLFLIYIYFSCVAHIIHLATKKCLNTIYPEGNKTGGDNDEGKESWEAGDLLSKVLVLVKQVCLNLINYLIIPMSDPSLTSGYRIFGGVLSY